MDFCPACGMLLQIQPATGGHRLRLFCPTCPYVCPIKNKIVKKARLVKREVESAESAPKTEGEPKESAPKTDGEPKADGQLKQSAPKTEGELFTLLFCLATAYWNSRLSSPLNCVHN
ncbi:hypothetical protein CFC21_083962 [Triticum aestivum]|uniref:DNA-directed RNA polymerase II subunit RPB9-like zinc ribbon domain-containing protein n=4 Tax=Triticum TaxID=4564 RepID=A0A9R1B1F7_TRITD|nr:hypothetical protein TRIUR3_26115 [Triticum urartu]KAF7079774.1 hypothetical protein CFC21_083962 [Triticum aestivum]VAI47979.1 unnamed protein product [Triticum turgidum subsp. durum]